jgi:hypothetical protein
MARSGEILDCGFWIFSKNFAIECKNTEIAKITDTTEIIQTATHHLSQILFGLKNDETQFQA